MSFFYVAAATLIVAVSTHVPYADLEVRSARLDYARPANTFGLSAIIANNGPNAANAAAVAYLPPGMSVRNDTPCVQSQPGAGTIVRCEFGTLSPGEERHVFLLVVTTEKRPHVAITAVSDQLSPDPDGSNNMKDATTP